MEQEKSVMEKTKKYPQGALKDTVVFKPNFDLLEFFDLENIENPFNKKGWICKVVRSNLQFATYDRSLIGFLAQDPDMPSLFRFYPYDEFDGGIVSLKGLPIEQAVNLSLEQVRQFSTGKYKEEIIAFYEEFQERIFEGKIHQQQLGEP